MFERLFSKAVASTGSVGASGSASFQESSANVGDTLHADFTWSGASYHFVGECYATMYIYDPSGNVAKSYIEGSSYSGSKTLSCIANMVGTWLSVIKVWNGRIWIEYSDTVSVTEPGGEGSAEIRTVNAPASFVPDVPFYVNVTIKNIGSFDDDLFVRITNSDTGAVLCESSISVAAGTVAPYVACELTLSQTTDFHGLVEVGHMTGDQATRWEIAVVPEQHEYWITQRMIDVVGSNKADDLFANIDPPDAQVSIFQYDEYGGIRSWCNTIPGDTLDIVSTDFPIIVGGEPSTIIIGSE